VETVESILVNVPSSSASQGGTAPRHQLNPDPRDRLDYACADREEGEAEDGAGQSMAAACWPLAASGVSDFALVSFCVGGAIGTTATTVVAGVGCP
jgi:hypothetical protein